MATKISMTEEQLAALVSGAVAKALEGVKATAAKPAKAEMPVSAEPIGRTEVRILTAAEGKALGLPEGTPILPLCRYEAPCRRTKYNGGHFVDYGSVVLPYGSTLSVNEIRSEGGFVLRFTK